MKMNTKDRRAHRFVTGRPHDLGGFGAHLVDELGKRGLALLFFGDVLLFGHDSPFLRVSRVSSPVGFQVGGRAARDKVAGGAWMIADVRKTKGSLRAGLRQLQDDARLHHLARRRWGKALAGLGKATAAAS